MGAENNQRRTGSGGRRRRRGLTRLIIALNLIALLVLISGTFWLNLRRVGMIDERILSLRTQGAIIAAALAESATTGPEATGVDEALAILRFANKAAAVPVAKAIVSAAANAEENHGLSRSDLVVARMLIDEGPTLRRGRAGARGRYKPLLKRSAHITVVLAERGQA